MVPTDLPPVGHPSAGSEGQHFGMSSTSFVMRAWLATRPSLRPVPRWAFRSWPTSARRFYLGSAKATRAFLSELKVRARGRARLGRRLAFPNAQKWHTALVAPAQPTLLFQLVLRLGSAPPVRRRGGFRCGWGMGHGRHDTMRRACARNNRDASGPVGIGRRNP